MLSPYGIKRSCAHEVVGQEPVFWRECRFMLTLSGNTLTIEDVARVAKGGVKVAISTDALRRISSAQETIQRYLRDNLPVYGVNTGFGALCDTSIQPGSLRELQQNLLRSHASGTGRLFPSEVVRGAMLLRANNFCRGQSGVRAVVVETLVDMINQDVIPAVRSCGSLGASGDLAPLADLALVLTGEGRAWYQGELLDGREAMARAGIAPLRLEAKEGLALLNGTAFMTSMAALSCNRALRYLEAQDAAAALSLMGFDGTAAPYTEELIGARPHLGAQLVGNHMRFLVEGSPMAEKGRKVRVQDPYSFRCVPQVHGAALTALLHAIDVITVEINSATDNPLVVDGQVISGGNFHGQPVGTAMDYLTLSLTSVASMSERRVNQLLDSRQSGLSAFLIPDPGLNSGLMIAQYTAASLVNECRVLATPASIQSIPVSAEQEDHISMATFASTKALQVMEKATAVTAVELLTAAQAVDLRWGGKRAAEAMGKALGCVYSAVRRRVPFISRDEPLSGYIDELVLAIDRGEMQDALREAGSSLRL